MKVKVIKVTFKFWGGREQEILKEGDIDLVVVPVKGDKIFIDDIGYKVLQRDIHIKKNIYEQRITLFVEKL